MKNTEKRPGLVHIKKKDWLEPNLFPQVTLDKHSKCLATIINFADIVIQQVRLYLKIVARRFKHTFKFIFFQKKFSFRKKLDFCRNLVQSTLLF